MAELSSAGLSIELIAGTSDAICTGTVHAELTPFELFLVNAAGLGVQLECNLMGDDGGLTGGDDLLFTFPAQSVGAAGDFAFQATVSRDTLDEDGFLAGDDEVFAHFSLNSNESAFPLHAEANSPVISGDF